VLHSLRNCFSEEEQPHWVTVPAGCRRSTSASDGSGPNPGNEHHHPDDSELRRYCAGLGDEEFIAMIDQHVLECEDCFPKVIEIVRNEPPKSS